MDSTTFQLVFGIVITVIGIGLIYWINHRKFNRRNAAGIEGFSSFEASVFVRFIERIGKWIAYALTILGVLLISTYNLMKKEREKKQIQTEQVH